MSAAVAADAAASASRGGAADAAVGDLDADLERRFGGLRRLYGDAAYLRIRAARIAVVGVGGVGSWTAEALARSGVAALTLIDLDHVAESNVNRQVQALGSTLGMAKVEALRGRIADIHPGCVVHAVEEFADPANWPGLLPEAVDAVVDACDQGRAKAAIVMRDGRAYVYLVDGSSKVSAQAVTTGRRQDDRVELLSKLPADAQVVASGGAFLSDGVQVTVKQPEAKR